MADKSIALITSSAGHGFMDTVYAVAYNQQPFAFSEKDNREDFEKEVDEIYERLSPFVPNMKKASWDKAQDIRKQGISYREKLLSKELQQSDWEKFAQTSLSVNQSDKLPEFKSLGNDANNIVVMLIPQKLFSDGKCGLNASQQSVPLETLNFFKSEDGNTYLLGQHFNKNPKDKNGNEVKDFEHVKNLAQEFNMYIPGEKEDTEVLGIRGVPHVKYLNMYKKTDIAVGIAGTHTWYMLACFPEKPQIIFYNKNGVENWDEIAKTYQKLGHSVYALGFDEHTDWKRFSLEAKALYTKISKKIRQEKNRSTKSSLLRVEHKNALVR